MCEGQEYCFFQKLSNYLNKCMDNLLAQPITAIYFQYSSVYHTVFYSREKKLAIRKLNFCHTLVATISMAIFKEVSVPFSVNYSKICCPFMLQMDPTLEVAINKVVSKQKHVIAATYDEESGEILFVGDNKWILSLENDEDLKKNLIKTLKETEDDEEDLVKEKIPRTHFEYPKLQFDVTNTRKESQKTIRTALNTIFEIQGFGKNKSRKYGKGPPPKGWPVGGFPWANFKGSTNSTLLGNSDVIRLICSLMEESGFNPQTHVEDDVLNAKNPEVPGPVVHVPEVLEPAVQHPVVQAAEVQDFDVQVNGDRIFELQVPEVNEPEVKENEVEDTEDEDGNIEMDIGDPKNTEDIEYNFKPQTHVEDDIPNVKIPEVPGPVIQVLEVLDPAVQHHIVQAAEVQANEVQVNETRVKEHEVEGTEYEARNITMDIGDPKNTEEIDFEIEDIEDIEDEVLKVVG